MGIEKTLLEKYHSFLSWLKIYENNKSIKLSTIIINEKARGSGIGTKIIQELVNYADKNGQIVTVTPSSEFGGDKNKLTQFYKKFGFKLNQGYNQNDEYNDTMIRYPKTVGMRENMKTLIKTLLREAIDKTIKCSKCPWHWKESESNKKDLYICHKCGHDNTPKKKSLSEGILTKEEKDILNVTNFVNFAKKFLDIDDDVKVELAFEKTPDITTTAYYHNEDKLVKVYAKDRATVDVCRSIAHELVHHKQNIDGRLNDIASDGSDGSPIENEANATAGVIMRKWGKLHPEIYS